MSLTPNALADLASVIPVLTVSDVADAAPLARALEAGGLKVIEITWRTTVALDALQAMKIATPGLIVGMGTIRSPEQVARSVSAGADFLVSPGLTPRLAPVLHDAGVPVLPGVATASEAMTAAEAGFELLKFFPAEQAGGIDYLRSLQGPLPDIRFCPTGSITREQAPEYLALGNVACVGGSWVAAASQVKARDWAGIEANARAAAAMRT